MPAQIETLADCASNYGVFIVAGKSGIYTVTFNGSEGPAFCTCPAYRYSGDERHCKHIAQTWEGACMYNAQWCEGHNPVKFRPIEYVYDAVIPDELCPACGGPMVAVRRAV